MERASIRGIDPLEVKEALLNGEIIENYPEDKRGHSCLAYGKTLIKKDIHVLCGVAYDILWVITVYEPDPEEWVNPKMRGVVSDLRQSRRLCIVNRSKRSKNHKARAVWGIVAEDLFERGLCLPSGTAMTEGDLDRVIQTILKSYAPKK